MGITQTIFLSLIAEIVPEDLRGTGFGCYYIICAFSEYFANHIIAGVISQHFGQSKMFLASGIIAAFSLLLFVEEELQLTDLYECSLFRTKFENIELRKHYYIDNRFIGFLEEFHNS